MAKHKNKKPRQEYVYGTTANKVSSIEVIYDPATDSFRFGGEMENTYSQITYSRKKGEKVLSRLPQSNNGIFHNQHLALEKNYDFLCAVDTNTRIIKEKRVSAVGVLVIESVYVPQAQSLGKAWQFSSPFCFEFVEIRGNPENFGWLAALEEFARLGVLDGKKKVGMIVDSDLGNIPDFNSQKKPIFADVLLPENVQLIYASTDVGKESPVNKMISVADSISSQCLHALESEKVPFNQKTTSHIYYERIRIIKPNMESTGWL